mgnify:FL=1
MKKFIKTLVLTLIIVTLVTPVAVYAQPSTRTVVKKYDEWSDRYIFDGRYNSPNAWLTDINKDGVLEMILQYEEGVRSGLRVYTYKNGKIILMKKLSGINGFNRVKGTKYLSVEWSNGAFDSGCTVYKMAGTKLKQVYTYRMLSSGNYTKYTKNGKVISRSEFEKFYKKLCKFSYHSWNY